MLDVRRCNVHVSIISHISVAGVDKVRSGSSGGGVGRGSDGDSAILARHDAITPSASRSHAAESFSYVIGVASGRLARRENFPVGPCFKRFFGPPAHTRIYFIDLIIT